MLRLLSTPTATVGLEHIKNSYLSNNRRTTYFYLLSNVETAGLALYLCSFVLDNTEIQQTMMILPV